MLTELCQYLHNWFDRKPDGTKYPKYSGSFTVSDGEIVELAGQLVDGQYFRILGSLFNDGVHQYGDKKSLTDEVFEGAVWSMGIPPAVANLAVDITAWRTKFEAVDSPAMSPYNSESFGGYSYSKSAGGSGSGSGTGSSGGWPAVFAARLAPWRKI